MKAAIVTHFDQPPRYGELDAPEQQAGEQLVAVRAAALSQLVRLRATGKHYSCSAQFPQVPGVDGVGLLPDGRRVFFLFPRAPFGAMAEQVPAAEGQWVEIPDDVDDATAAAIGNPGMSSVAALEHRARFLPGESVLINGASGASGRLAIQIARHMGAARVVATARNPAIEAELLALGADSFICTQQSEPDLTAAFRETLNTFGIDIVLDYLWGPAAGSIFEALSHSDTDQQKPLRFINIGSMASLSLPLNAGTLRGSQLELMGSGLGSVSNRDLLQSIGKVLQWVKPAGLKISVKTFPLQQFEAAWQYSGPERVVLTL